MRGAERRARGCEGQKVAESGNGHLPPSCAAPSEGSFSPVSGPQGYTAGAAALGQSTKSLRSSPLRGDVSREACDRSTGLR